MTSQKIAVAYCRVSTDEQAKEGLSIETQEKVCNEQIIKDGFEHLPALKDEGKSGKDMNRPAIKQLIHLVNEKQIQAVYVVHSDRIGRDVEQYLAFRRLLRKQEISLKSIYQPMLDDNSATGQTMDTMMAAFSQMQRLITSEKVQGVMREIAKAGYFPTCPPAGYLNKKNPDSNITRIGRNIIAVDPIMGPLITEAFHRYARGDVNVYELTEVMSAKGLRNQQGRRVQANSMYSLLRNRIYLGEIHWGGIEVKEGKHAPLIDEHTFNSVQTIMAEKNHRMSRRRKYKWLLTGLITCPRHNKRFCAEWHLNKKIAYYHCTYRKGCGKYIEQTKLEDMVADKFRDLQFSDEFINLVIEKAKRIFMERRQKYDSRRQAFVNRRTALETRRRVAEEKLFTGTISDEDFTRIRKELQVDLSEISDELLRLEDQRELSVDVAQEVLLFTRDIYKAYKKASHDLKRHFLIFFWDHFEVMNWIIIKSVSAPLFDSLLSFEAAYYRNQKEDNPEEPTQTNGFILSNFQCARQESNPEPLRPKRSALSVELRARNEEIRIILGLNLRMSARIESAKIWAQNLHTTARGQKNQRRYATIQLCTSPSLRRLTTFLKRSERKDSRRTSSAVAFAISF